jgi:hypothetical protein
VKIRVEAGREWQAAPNAFKCVSTHVLESMLISALAQTPSHNSAPSPQTLTPNHKAQSPMAKNECQRPTSPIVVSVRLSIPFLISRATACYPHMLI